MHAQVEHMKQNCLTFLYCSQYTPVELVRKFIDQMLLLPELISTPGFNINHKLIVMSQILQTVFFANSNKEKRQPQEPPLACQASEQFS